MRRILSLLLVICQIWVPAALAMPYAPERERLEQTLNLLGLSPADVQDLQRKVQEFYTDVDFYIAEVDANWAKSHAADAANSLRRLLEGFEAVKSPTKAPVLFTILVQPALEMGRRYTDLLERITLLVAAHDQTRWTAIAKEVEQQVRQEAQKESLHKVLPVLAGLLSVGSLVTAITAIIYASHGHNLPFAWQYVVIVPSVAVLLSWAAYITTKMRTSRLVGGRLPSRLVEARTQALRASARQTQAFQSMIRTCQNLIGSTADAK